MDEPIRRSDSTPCPKARSVDDTDLSQRCSCDREIEATETYLVFVPRLERNGLRIELALVLEKENDVRSRVSFDFFARAKERES